MQVNIVKLQDPQLDIVDRTYYAKMGGSDVTYNHVDATTWGNSQVVFSTTTPSVNVGVSRRMKVLYKFIVTFGPPGGANDANRPSINDINGEVASGMRAYPVSSITDTLTVKLNNSTSSINLSDQIHALMTYGTNPDERNHFRSTTPSYPDQCDYTGEAYFSAGGRNPFAHYATNNIETTRGFRIWVDSITVSATSALRVQTATIEVLENLFISPFNWSEHDVQALFGIQTIDINMSLGNLKRIFSGSANQSLSRADTTVAVADKPTLYISYLSPQITMPIQKVLHYPYYDVNRYITSNPTAVAQTDWLLSVGVPEPASVPTNVNNVVFHAIPKRIYILAQERFGDKSTGDNCFQKADIFAVGDYDSPLSINWNNRAGILSSASLYDIYELSVKNGLNMSWIQFSRYIGSVICLEPSCDIPLSAVQAPGTRGNFQIAYIYKYKNNKLRAGNTYYDVYTIAVQEGFMTINDSVISLDTGVLTEQSVLEAPFAPAGTYNEIRNLYGGGFWNNVWKGIKGVRDVITKGSDVVGKVAGMIPHPIAQGIAGIASNVGDVGRALGGRRSGGALSGGVGTGGRRKGGRRMSARSLSRRL